MPPPGGTKTDLSTLQASLRFRHNPSQVSGQFTPAEIQAYQPPSGQFTPGLPLRPTDPQPVRRFPFQPGTNTQLSPRQYEPFGFEQLRAFANVEPIRLAIETRKDQIERMDWGIKVRDNRRRRSDADDRIRKVEKFWRKPDGELPFATWLRSSMEDLLVLDAPAFEKRRDRGGRLIGLDIVDGATIRLLVDSNGRRPKFPVPAYQQVVYGRPWSDLTTQDLLYVPRNVRPHKLYGFAPVEQVIVTINVALQRQASQLFHFGIGNVPAGLISAPEGWTSDQIGDFQAWFDSQLSGNVGEKQKLIWVPQGSQYQAFKDAPLKDEFDEWLYRIVCFCFSLPPTPFIKSSNRATAEQADQTALEEGREPLLRWWKRAADDIIQDELDCPDLEWAWQPPDDIDPLKKAQLDDLRLRNGSITINEVRERDGEYPIDGGDVPRIYLPTGAVSLAGIDAAERTNQDAAELEIDTADEQLRQMKATPLDATGKKPVGRPKTSARPRTRRQQSPAQKAVNPAPVKSGS